MNAAPVAPTQAVSPDLRTGSAVGLPTGKPPEKPRRKPPVKPPEQPTGKAAKSPSGSGSHLAAVAGITWEPKRDGAIEAWHAPPGAVQRKDKTYLGRAGKSQLEEWDGLDADARQKAVEGWIAMQREKKGIQ